MRNEVESSPASAPASTRLSVGGMNCQGCVQNVTGAALRVPGVETVDVSLEEGSAVVQWRAGAEPVPEEVCQAIRAAGHPAEVVPLATSSGGKSRFAVRGMTCGNCAARVRDAAQSVPGVDRAEVDLEQGTLTVLWEAETQAGSAAVVSALKHAGYLAQPLAAPEGTSDTPASSRRRPLGWGFNVAVGGASFLVFLVGEWGLHLDGESWFRWLGFGLAAVVQVLCGGRFYRGAWQQLKAGHSNMDTLVSLGSTAAFGYSAGALLLGVSGHLYFMEAVGIITLISLGHWLEGRASAKAADALRALLHLAPPTARWLNAADVETVVPVERLGAGDRILLKPGDHVPVDGEILEGGGSFDESMLTGEALPVEKGPGAKLYTGTVNQSGRVIMRVTATGERTALARIIALVRRAQASRAGIQRLADRISSVFVPVVGLIALATAAWWGFFPDHAARLTARLSVWLWPVTPTGSPLAAAVIHATAVLIVACPCALGLATPAAIMAGANAAARRGILIRDGAALEKTGRIDTVVFDKTGTLTAGRPTVAAWEDLRPEANKNIPLPALAAALAAGSNHPLSRALAENPDPERHSGNGGTDHGAVRGRPPADVPELQEWGEIRGAGVQARLGDAGASFLRLGDLDWLTKHGVSDAAGGDFPGRWREEGATVLGLAVGERLLGRVALRDPLKPAVPAVIRALRRAGLVVQLLTGDNPRTALALARQAGIAEENVEAGVRPEAKASRIQALQSAGRRVAFVGDGINDAPALEQADLGVAVTQASDIAREAADIVLLRSGLEAVPEALGLARSTLRTIHQNLFWAVFYNAAAVPLAALGFLSPLVCAAAMGLSDLLVIGNALRLRACRPRSERTAA